MRTVLLNVHLVTRNGTQTNASVYKEIDINVKITKGFIEEIEKKIIGNSGGKTVSAQVLSFCILEASK